MLNLGFGRVIPSDTRLIMGGGWRDGGPIAAGIKHQGVDIRLAQGTPILAAGDGVATFVGPAADAGNMVVITHPSGVQSRYLHLSEFSVGAGQPVAKGQQIGLSGNTGNSEAPHLHFDLKVPAFQESLLSAVRDAVGEPVGGFGPNTIGTGFGIPAEPWLPVDEYTPNVVTNAKLFGIPLHGFAGVVANLGKFAPFILIGGAGVLFYLLWRE